MTFTIEWGVGLAVYIQATGYGGSFHLIHLILVQLQR